MGGALSCACEAAVTVAVHWLEEQGNARAAFCYRFHPCSRRLPGAQVPTTLAATKDGRVVQQKLTVLGQEWTATAVSMGNPHCVIFTSPDGQPLDVNAMDLAAIGPSFERSAAFPRRTNTEFVQVLARDRLRMRVWERGAGATLACGTGACATVVAAVLEGRADRKCTVDLPGGPLEILWDEGTNRITMTGPAEAVFSGTISP